MNGTNQRQPRRLGPVAVRYGMRVVGFLPDPDKIERGEIVSSISRSPAAEAGIQLDDVLIGINGTAFLLPALPSSISSQELQQHYKIQKEKIVRSIHQSPNPVVIHVRRQRANQKTPSSDTITGDRQTSLLDTTFQDDDAEDPTISIKSTKTLSSPDLREQHQPPIQRLRPSSSYDPSPAPTAPIKRSTPTVHPFAEALVRRKLILSREDQWRISQRLHHFTERTRQWESSNSLKLVEGSCKLVPFFDPNDLPPDMASLMMFQKSQDDGEEKKNYSSVIIDDDGQRNQDEHTSSRISHAFWGAPYAPSTPPLTADSPLIPFEYLQAFYGDEKARQIRSSSSHGRQSWSDNVGSANEEFPMARRLFQRRQTWDPFQDQDNSNRSGQQQPDVVWIPLYGIRKSLSARIVNSFVEEGVSSQGYN